MNMSFRLFLEKITEPIIGTEEIKKFILDAHQKYLTGNDFSEIWIEKGGSYSDNIIFNQRAFILPDYLYKYFLENIVLFVFSNKIGGEAFTKLSNKQIEIFIDISQDSDFEESLDHELNHLANLITIRKSKSGLKYNLLNKSGQKFVGSDNIQFNYLAHDGEIDAFARQFAEFYKRKFPGQKFNWKKLKDTTTTHWATTDYQDMLKDEKYYLKTRRLMSKIATEVNKSL